MANLFALTSCLLLRRGNPLFAGRGQAHVSQPDFCFSRLARGLDARRRRVATEESNGIVDEQTTQGGRTGRQGSGHGLECQRLGLDGSEGAGASRTVSLEGMSLLTEVVLTFFFSRHFLLSFFSLGLSRLDVIRTAPQQDSSDGSGIDGVGLFCSRTDVVGIVEPASTTTVRAASTRSIRPYCGYHGGR